MVLFILFPGLGMSEKNWEKYSDSGKIKKTNFLKQLKKLGKVYTYTPNINSIIKLDAPNEIRKAFYKNPSELNLDDMNIDIQCKYIYEDVKKYKEPFIPVGHSIGAYFAIHFSKLYSSRCIKTILIEPSLIAPKNVLMWYKEVSLTNTIKNHNITNNYLSLLNNKLHNKAGGTKFLHSKDKKIIEKITTEIYTITFYLYTKFFKKFSGSFIVPNLSIVSLRDFDIKKKSNNINDGIKLMIDDQEILYKKNKTKFQVHYLINATHYPWFIPRYCDEIIEQIKCFI